MPFNKKPGPDGIEIDFDSVFHDLLAPAVEAAGLYAHRADADRRGGSIHADMFQDLLFAEFVVADLTLDNANVWYELGVRHALRKSGTVLTYAIRDRLPFDIAGERMQRYTLKAGCPDPNTLASDRNALTEAIKATLADWRGRRASPVYAQIPNLKEPDWKTLKVGDINEYWDALDQWRERVEIARQKSYPGDIMVLSEETPNRLLELEALRTAADALIKMKRPLYALNILERAKMLDPDDLRCQQLKGLALGRVGRFVEARAVLEKLAQEHRDGETLGLLARTWKDEWSRLLKSHPQYSDNALVSAQDTESTLSSAAQAYRDAFSSDPADYFPGINAVTLGYLWEHVTGSKLGFDLKALAGGVCWAVDCTLAHKRDYWALATRAELALDENKAAGAAASFNEAATLARHNRDAFGLDSTSQQLDLLGKLGFRSTIVERAAKIID